MCVWVNGTMDNSLSSAEQPVDAAAPLSEPPDLSAFERAAALRDTLRALEQQALGLGF